MQTSNKHIFIVTYDYPPSNGGIARLCFELKKYLEKKGLNVTVICPQSTSTDAEEDNNVSEVQNHSVWSAFSIS